jgi:hypothetical protein
VKKAIGIGADLVLFQRDSHFAVTNSTTGETVQQHISQRNPQLKIYISVNHSQH